MADVHSKQVRSYNMSKIRAKNTKPEMKVRQFLHACGFRYRLHARALPGKPDLVLPKYKTVVFIHGCFWHGHRNCRYFVVPKTRTEWWLNKINKNKSNDKKVTGLLREAGWKIIVIWECDLKVNKLTRTLTKLQAEILAGRQ